MNVIQYLSSSLRINVLKVIGWGLSIGIDIGTSAPKKQKINTVIYCDAELVIIHNMILKMR